MKHVRALVSGVAVLFLAMGAQAQDQKPADQAPPAMPGDGAPQRGPGGPGMGGGMMGGRPLSAEKAKAAWELEAKGVAHRLGLTADQTKSLTAAYLAARESQQSATEKIRQEAMQKAQENGGGFESMREMMKQVEETTTAERAKFKQAISGSLSSEQADKAVASLGTFSRQWDRIVDVFGGFKLEGDKQQQGLNAIEDYSVAMAAAQAKAQAAIPQGPPNRQAPAEGGAPGAAGTEARDAMRNASQEGRKKLTEALQPMLSKEQMTKIEETIGGGRMGEGGGRGGRRNGGS
ncbi:MAG: hypothetical protein U0573_09195 [Phycisphaerales bacterium]|nr:hypothetical protein [Planctomycetota bacterium]